MSAFITVLKMAWKNPYTRGLIKLLVLLILGLLIAWIVTLWSLWNQFLCKMTWGIYGKITGLECNDEKEVLTYEPVTEKDVKKLGQDMRDLRERAAQEVLDQDVADHVSKRTIDEAGELYGDLPIRNGSTLGGGKADPPSNPSAGGGNAPGGGGSSVGSAGEGGNFNFTLPWTVTASDLNKRLKGLLAGKGDAYMAAGEKYNVNPAFLVGVSMQETSNGSSPMIKKQNNVGGIKCPGSATAKAFTNGCASNGFATYASLEDSLMHKAWIMRNVCADNGAPTIVSCGKKYSEGDPQWVTNVVEIMGKAGQPATNTSSTSGKTSSVSLNSLPQQVSLTGITSSTTSADSAKVTLSEIKSPGYSWEADPKGPYKIGPGKGKWSMMTYVEAAYNDMAQHFSGLKFMGSYNDRNVRGGSTKSQHAYSNAFDVGATPETMKKIAEYMRKNPTVEYVIYNRQISQKGSDWRPYTGSNPHTDHVHVDFQKITGAGSTKSFSVDENAGGDGSGSGGSEVLGNKVVQIAERYLKERGTGNPNKSERVIYSMTYRNLNVPLGKYGDCSSFTHAVFAEAGVKLGGNTSEQVTSKDGQFFDNISELKPGDLIYFKKREGGHHGYSVTLPNGKSASVAHVGIYVGDGEMIHLSTGGENTINRMKLDKLKDRFIGAKRMGEPGDGSFQMEASGETESEAELHLRALNQIDLFAMSDNLIGDLTEKNLENNKKLKDSKLEKIWWIAKEMRDYAKSGTSPDNANDKAYQDLYKRSIEAQRDGVGENWKVMNWILYTQHEAYKCYYIGDESKETNGVFINFWKDLFKISDKPCESLDKLYTKAMYNRGKIDSEDDLQTYIKKDDRAKIRHQHYTIQETIQCTPKETKEDKKDEKKDDKKDKVAAFFKETFTFIDKAEASHTSSTTTIGSKCGKDETETKTTEEKTYLTYQRLIDMVYDFEPYSVYETGKTVDKIDGTFKETIDLILFENYQAIQNEVFQNTPSVPWIVPMEKGTYNYGRGFQPPSDPGHQGVDMGTLSVQRVPIYASGNGKVISVGRNDGGYGGIVLIDHNNGYYTQYSHLWLKDIVVKEGQTVQQAQLLAGVGNDMRGDAWHLHFEICKEIYDASGGVKLCKNQLNPEDPEFGMKMEGATQDMDLTKKRAAQFDGKIKTDGDDKKWDDMAKRAREGELILMPGYNGASGEFGEVGGGNRGDWVKEFESNGNPGAYWDDPVGGNSLGLYQLTERTSNGGKGSLYPFGDLLKSKYPQYYQALSPYDPTSSSFVQRWKALAKSDPEGFTVPQIDFINQTHYMPAVTKVEKAFPGFKVAERSRGIREMLWSSGIQYPGFVPSIFKQAMGGKDPKSMSDEEIVKAFYKRKLERVPSDFSSSSASVKASITKRYQNERDKVLSMMSQCGC